MRAWETFRVALQILRGRRGLWGLFGVIVAEGAVSTLASLLYGLTFGAVAIWLSLSTLQLSGDTGVGEARMVTDWLTAGVDWLSASGWLVGVVSVIGAAVWLVASVLSIAAQGGLVQQVDGLYAGAQARTSVGLRAGFSAWWRVAGLVALPMLPALLVGLATSVSLFVTISLPIMRGEAPDPAAAMILSRIGSSLSAPVWVVQTLLAVVAITAIRPVMLEGTTIGLGLQRAWRVLKADWVGYVGVLAVSMVFGFAVGAAGWMVIAVAGGLGVIAAGAAWAAAPALSVVIAAIVGMVVLGVFGFMVALVHTVQSIAYTLWWREARLVLDAGIMGEEAS